MMNEPEYVVKDSFGTGPMTELITILDNKGRLHSKAGRASEGAEYNFVRYRYDDNGDVTALLLFPVGMDDFGSADSIIDRKGLIFGTDYDHSECSAYYFERNEDRQIIRVYDQKNNDIFDAPDGFYFDFEVAEDENFWTSCLDGGHFKVLFHLRRVMGTGSPKDGRHRIY